ncbi:MAG: hypothetical protein M4579_001819 [Chaenotheca gracillima]|nr:MAG: hypothetical protein M4579_001819 [Chaenotheca gracillima]
MSAPSVLSDRDTNAPLGATSDIKGGKPDINSMDYHRQMLQSKLKEESSDQKYISPSDNIMSPCTEKLSAYRNKHFKKIKPQSLFAKTSSKNIGKADASSSAESSDKETTSSSSSGL